VVWFACVYLSADVVDEKESRTKEIMRIMGLQDWVFAASWFISYFLLFTLTALLVTLMMCYTVWQSSSMFLVFALFVAFTCAAINLSFLIATFFNKAKLASIIAPIVVFAFAMPRYAFYSSDPDQYIGPKIFVRVSEFC